MKLKHINATAFFLIGISVSGQGPTNLEDQSQINDLA